MSTNVCMQIISGHNSQQHAYQKIYLSDPYIKTNIDFPLSRFKIIVHIVMLAVSSGKRNVTFWSPSVRMSVCPVGILTVTHHEAA